MIVVVSLFEVITAWKEKAKAFENDAHEILARHEGSQSRVISLENTRKRLEGLSVQQHELFQQALECIERGIYRAAHVMAWAAFVDVLEQKLASDGLTKLQSARSAWNKWNSIEEIRENVPEFQLIEAARELRLFSKPETKSILGLLSKRNECAHPSSHRPSLNESLGYVSDLLNRVERLLAKSP